jgi:hypothetical protein
MAGSIYNYKAQGIENALSYLADLDVEVWYDSAQVLEEADNW